MSTPQGQGASVPTCDGTASTTAGAQPHGDSQASAAPPFERQEHDTPTSQSIFDPPPSARELREQRERTLTDRGLQFQLEVKERAVATAVSRWRRKADDLEYMLADSEDASVIMHAMGELVSLMATCEEKLDALYSIDPNSSTTIEGVIDRHQEITRRVGSYVKGLKSDKGSSRSHRSSRGSSKTSIGMKAATKAAEISAQLQYCQQEQELEKQQMAIKQKQQMLVLERELAKEKAKLQAITEHSHASSIFSDVDETLAKLPVDTSRVETYVRQHSLSEREDVESARGYNPVVTTTVSTSAYPIDQRTTDVKAYIATTAAPTNVIHGANTEVYSAHLYQPRRTTTTAVPPGIYARAPLPAHTLNPFAAPYLPPVFGVQRSQIGYQLPLMSTCVSVSCQPRNDSHGIGSHLGIASATTEPLHSRQTNNEPRSDLTILAQAITEQNSAARLPPPEPGVFTGNPLEYNAWKRSFELLIEQKSITPAEKLYYLRRYVAGEAKDCIEGFLLESSDCAYADAKERLDERFGSQFHVANAFRKKLREWPKIPNKDGPALQRLSDFLKQCESAQRTNADLDILNDPMENQIILRKLPDDIIRKWSKSANDTKDTKDTSKQETQHVRKRSYPPFSKFSKFIADEARMANNPITSFHALRNIQDPPATTEDKKGSRKERKQTLLSNVKKSDKTKQQSSSEQTDKKSSNTSTKEDTKSERKKRPCFLCKNDHHINDCPDFLKDTLEDRKKYASSNKLCFGCLNPNHLAKACKYKKRCKICDKRHPTSLHDENWQKEKKSETTQNDQPVVSHSTSVASGNKASMIVPVFISHNNKPGKEILVYALLDTQSDATFVSEETCDRLGVDGPETQLLLSTLSAEHQVLPCKKVTGLRIRGYNSSTVLTIHRAYTKKSIPVNRTHIPSPEMAMKWQHLHRIANELMPITDCDIGLLIGYNCPRALTPREVIPAPGDEAYAQRTDLGWGIVGTLDYNSNDVDEVVTHKIVTRNITPPIITENDELSRKSVVFSVKGTKTKEIINPVDLRNLIDADFTTAGDFCSTKRSVDDERFLQILNDGIKRTDDGHFEMPLPFRDKDPALPNNRCIAEKRLAGLRKRLLKDEHYRADYFKFMNGIIDKGFAEKCNDTAPPKKVWYMPHHGVYHPKKKKIRVVFDASAQHAGISLNDQLLQGPDLINGLLGILCRFRKEQIAICCDIEQMFYQFKVSEQHRDYFRFLWWEGNLNEPPTEFRMTVHLFGAKSSPGCANYGLKMAADYAEDEYGSEAADFVRDNFYVDDGLTSVKTENDAITLIDNTQQLCAESGIRLHKFASNSKTVMQAIPEDDRAADLQNLDLLKSCDVVERTLGLEWSIVNDSFQFRIVFKNRPPTRRGILSSVSVIYDPLGFLAPVILVGKRILQDICQQRFDWDTPLPQDIVHRWETWKNELFKLEALRIPRCYKPFDFGEVTSVQLHHFCDASTVGYGQCSYLRMVNANGKVHCSLVIAKSRVAPVKQVTVPRLELSAAVLSVRISAFLKRELKYDAEEHFWTDSTVVLGYINSNAKRFHVFVANRIQQIRDCSDADQWRYVTSEENPADYASRGLKAEKFMENTAWFNGPEFLWSSELPSKTTTPSVDPGDPELKRVYTLQADTNDVFPSLLERLARFSSWQALRKAVAYCLMYKRILLNKATTTAKIDSTDQGPDTALTVNLLCEAEREIIKAAQRLAFPDITALESGKANALKKTSALYKLDPFLDNHGILRVGGRLEKSSLPTQQRNPVILPKNSFISALIAQSIHDQTHQGRGATLNALRENGYWIIGCKGIVSRIIHKCVTCRKLRGRLQYQKMAPLPEDRTEETPPFTYCGVDYFGPFYVKVKRSEVPRYGALFTCMTTRAIHLEMATSLDTDAFINALRRFIAIRGPIRHLRCDRGTNFVGARNIFDKEFAAINHTKVKDYLLQQNCDYFEFQMNPPHASHMGGVWERQIRTVRSVLQPMLDKVGTQLDDDALRTFFYEVMAIVNSRPLTLDNLHDPFSDVLSPNQLLTMKTKVVLPPPGNFVEQDLYATRRWRRVQYLVNLFWTKWKAEYLAELQKRQKWTRAQRNMEKGDIVLLQEDNTLRNTWPIAIVEEAYPSQDGKVRKVKVRLADHNLDKRGIRTKPQSVLERPVHKCVLLYKSAAADQGIPPPGNH